MVLGPLVGGSHTPSFFQAGETIVSAGLAPPAPLTTTVASAASGDGSNSSAAATAPPATAASRSILTPQ